jgi:hypothetical protein
VTKEPESLRTILTQVDSLIRRAYAEGYRQGSQDSADTMTRAAVMGMENRLGAILGVGGEPSTTPTPPGLTPPGTRMSPPKIGVAGEPRQYVYGSLIGTIRRALLASPETGMPRDEVIAYCRSHGVDATINNVKDALKRLVQGDEAEKHHGAFFPGPRLKREPLNGSADLLDTRRGHST